MADGSIVQALRACTKCRAVLPDLVYHFQSRGEGKPLHRWCRACVNAYQRQYWANRVAADGRAPRRSAEAVTADLLHDLYVTQGLTAAQCGLRLGFSTQTICNKLAEFGIPKRRGKPRQPKTCLDCGAVFHVYSGSESGLARCNACRGPNRWGKRNRTVTAGCAECGKPVTRTEAASKTAQRFFCGLPCRGAWLRTHQSGEAHPCWRGGSSAKQARVEGDPVKRLRRRISNGIWWSLKGDKRRRKWERLVGYTISDLRAHLERQFIDGMCWSNYGSWHVEHILPVSSFQITGPDCPEFRACWSLSNLRPMWAVDNLRKGAKVLTLL